MTNRVAFGLLGLFSVTILTCVVVYLVRRDVPDSHPEYADTSPTEERKPPPEFHSTWTAPDAPKVLPGHADGIDVSKVKPEERNTAHELGATLLHYCGARDGGVGVWSGLRELVVEHHTILDGGNEAMIWEFHATFPPNWKSDLLRGNTLWYRFDEGHTKVFAMKTVSGIACGVEAERWVAM